MAPFGGNAHNVYLAETSATFLFRQRTPFPPYVLAGEALARERKGRP